MFSHLRLVEDDIVQLQKADEDVEGLQEEAFCLTDVLNSSVYKVVVTEMRREEPL